MSASLQPVPAVIAAIDRNVPDHHLFTFVPQQPFELLPGQFMEVSLPGSGAFPVSTAGYRTGSHIETCIRRAGRVTSDLYSLPAGAPVGLRGPFGRGFPLEAFAGRDALLIAGGLGMPPLRALLQALCDPALDVRRRILLYGARSPDLLLYREELESLATSGAIELRFSVDFASEVPGGERPAFCRIGLVPQLLDGLCFEPSRTVTAVCGPPALYSCLLEELAALGLPEERIFVSLERHMKCGVGLCCHCVTAGVHLCREGPVFSLASLRNMPGAVEGVA